LTPRTSCWRAEAFLTHNAHVSATEETERFLDEDHRYLEDIGEIQDVVTVLQYLATQMQPRLLQVYAMDPTRRFLLSSGGTFLVSLAAACGYVRWRNNMKMLEGALDKLLGLLHRPVEDPLNLDAYQRTVTRITFARGKNMRIPRQSCHQFQANPATDSTTKLPPVPYESCH
jgi:hypothetical protein